MGVAHQATQRRPKGPNTLSGGSELVNGESIYYEASGMAECGPTVLFLHESGGSGEIWHPQLTGLSGGARCLAVDLPGHGRSEGVGRSTVEGYREAVIGFLDALALRWPVVVVGVCLGAAVAVDMARHAPGRVAGLVLVGTTEGGRVSPSVLERVSRGEAPEEFIMQLFGARTSDRTLLTRLQRWRLTNPWVRHADLKAVSEYPLAQALQAVTHPVLLVAGEEDAAATPEGLRLLAGPMFDARVGAIAKSGCMSMVEQPAAFNRAVSEFLTSRLRPACPVAPEVRGVMGYRRH